MIRTILIELARAAGIAATLGITLALMWAVT
jgi:hypothetical protein